MTAGHVCDVLFICAGNSARSILATRQAASLCPASAVLLRRELRA